tara:strand:+ start:148 stop:369 length:222 start_codon:yes stop_codon:yes gene_type:complete
MITPPTKYPNAIPNLKGWCDPDKDMKLLVKGFFSQEDIDEYMAHISKDDHIEDDIEEEDDDISEDDEDEEDDD